MSYQKQIIEFIMQSKNVSSIINVIECIPLQPQLQQQNLIKFIKHTSIENQRHVYYAIMPITLIFPTDITQFIISFNSVDDTILINKLFYSLTMKNESNHYRMMYKTIEDKSCHHMTRIVNNKRRLLHPVEISRGYIGPYNDLAKAINSCEDDDRILIHPGSYYIDDGLIISKKIEIVGLTIKNYKYDAEDIAIYFEEHLIVSRNIVTLKNLSIISFDLDTLVILNNATVIADNYKFQYTYISEENVDDRSMVVVHSQILNKK